MTAKPSIDPAEFLHEHLSQASPDLLRELMQGFVNALLSADADSVCGAAYGARDAGPHQPPQRLPATATWTPGSGPWRWRCPSCGGLLLPGLAAGAPPPGRGGADLGGGDLLPARGVHPPDGPAGAVPGDHRAVQVPGLGDGPRPRRAGRATSANGRWTPARTRSWPPTR